MHPSTTETVDPNIQQLVERQAKAWETANSDQIIADFADDCLFIIPGSRFTNKQEIKREHPNFAKRWGKGGFIGE